MALKTTTVKIGNHDINMVHFNAIEALKVRKSLVESVKKQVGNDISFDNNQAGLIKAFVGVLYETPIEVLLRLFKNCSAIGIGELSDQNNFNEVFNENIDGPIELVMEVLDFNGFFSTSIVSTLSKKIPMLKELDTEISKFKQVKTD